MKESHHKEDIDPDSAKVECTKKELIQKTNFHILLKLHNKEEQNLLKGCVIKFEKYEEDGIDLDKNEKEVLLNSLQSVYKNEFKKVFLRNNNSGSSSIRHDFTKEENDEINKLTFNAIIGWAVVINRSVVADQNTINETIIDGFKDFLTALAIQASEVVAEKSLEELAKMGFYAAVTGTAAHFVAPVVLTLEAVKYIFAIRHWLKSDEQKFQEAYVSGYSGHMMSSEAQDMKNSGDQGKNAVDYLIRWLSSSLKEGSMAQQHQSTLQFTLVSLVDVVVQGGKLALGGGRRFAKKSRKVRKSRKSKKTKKSKKSKKQ